MESPGDEFNVQLEIIRKSDNDFLHPNWLKAAKYFFHQAKHEHDIKEAVPYLLEIYTESNHIDIMEAAANAVIIHLLRNQKISEIKQILQTKQYPEYFLRPIHDFLQVNTDLTNLLPYLGSLMLSQQFVINNLFIKYIKLNPEHIDKRTEQIVLVFQLNQTYKSYFPRFLRDAASENIQVNHFLHVLIPYFHDKKLRLNTAREIQGIMSIVHPDEKFVDTLQQLLQDKDIAGKISAGLAHLFLKTKNFEQLDLLLNHSFIDIQKAAVQILTNNSISDLSDSEVLQRIIKAFLSSYRQFSGLAYECLIRSFKNKSKILPDFQTFETLLHAANQNPERDEVIEYIILCMQENHELAQQVITWYQSFASRPVAEIIQIAAQQILSETYHKPCSICMHIPRCKTYFFIADIPSEVEMLLPKTNYLERAESKILTCPECGNLYTYTQLQEFEDMTISTEIDLERITYLNNDKQIDKAVYQEYKQTFQQKLALHKNQIHSYVTYQQEDAIYFMLLYYRQANKWYEISKLFVDLSIKGKSVMLTEITEMPREFMDHGFIEVLYTHLISHGTKKWTPTLRRNAAYVCGIYFALADRFDQIRKFLRNQDIEIITGAVKALNTVNYNNWVDITNLYDDIVGFSQRRLGDLSDYARFTCHNLIKMHPERFELSSSILSDLKSRDIIRVINGITRLSILAQHNINLKWSYVYVAKLLHKQELTYRVLELTKVFIQNGKNISDLLPSVYKALKKKKHNNITSILTVIKMAVEAGYNVNQVLPQVAHLLHSSDDQTRAFAFFVFDALFTKNMDLSEYESDLVKAHKGRKDYYDERLIHMLTNIYLRRKAYAEINKLILHSQRFVRGSVLSYLSTYKYKNDVEISFLIKALMENLKHDNEYVKNSAQAVIDEYLLQDR